MSFSNISFKSTNTDVDSALKALAQTKLETLQKFFPDGKEARCEVEFAKETAHHSGRFFRFETNLTVDGVLYRAEATENSFAEAIDEVRSELAKELSRSQKKRDTLFLRGRRAIKKMMRLE